MFHNAGLYRELNVPILIVCIPFDVKHTHTHTVPFYIRETTPQQRWEGTLRDSDVILLLHHCRKKKQQR